jgi:rhodanese-related sulfurtransferase
MSLLTSVRSLDVAQADALVEAGAAYVDLRDVNDYLDVHVPGSISITYEFGPGMPGRARDCIPLEVPLVLLERPGIDMHHVSASFRGKGFAVHGVVPDGVAAWSDAHGSPASIEVYEGRDTPQGVVLDVGDPGMRLVKDARRATVERLWTRADEFAAEGPLVIAAGRGVRAAMAVGMLERAGAQDLVFWWTNR